MTSPFAEYELTAIPFPELRISMAVGSRIALDPAGATYVSRSRADTIYVEGSKRLFSLGWGGTQNHCVFCRDGVWRVDDLAHANSVRINGERLRHSQQHPLRNKDRVEPATGLIFTFFLCDELEPLAAELARQTAVLEAEPRVLMDWILERAALSADDAHRAIQHFRYRLARSGTL